MGDERSRDKKEKLTAGVDSLERNGLATIAEIYNYCYPTIVRKNEAIIEPTQIIILDEN